jgi:hypothetical protein
MRNDDFRRELNRVFDDVSGSPNPDLSDRVRSAVASAPEAPRPYWVAAVAAGVIAVLIIGVLVANNPLRRPTGPVGAATSPSPSASAVGSPTPSASPSASPSPAPSATPTSQLPAFVCGQQDLPAAQANQPPVAFIDSLRTGTHGSYDRLTVEFSNGTPQDVQVGAPGGTSFTASPSGMTITVIGQHGILVTMHGADLHTSYNGSIDIVTGYATLAEVRRVQDYEGVVQLALGVNGAGCYRAFWLTNPNRLVIDVQAAS